MTVLSRELPLSACSSPRGMSRKERPAYRRRETMMQPNVLLFVVRPL